MRQSFTPFATVLREDGRSVNHRSCGPFRFEENLLHDGRAANGVSQGVHLVLVLGQHASDNHVEDEIGDVLAGMSTEDDTHNAEKAGKCHEESIAAVVLQVVVLTNHPAVAADGTCKAEEGL